MRQMQRLQTTAPTSGAGRWAWKAAAALLLLGLLLPAGGCSALSAQKPAWGKQPADGTRYEYQPQAEVHLNKYRETVYNEPPQSVPVWRTKPGPETGPFGHELIQPEYVGYEARDVVVEQQRMGMTPGAGQWPQGVYPVAVPQPAKQPGLLAKVGGVFAGKKQEPAPMGYRTYNSDYSGDVGYGHGTNFGTSYGAGGSMNYIPVSTANWGGGPAAGTVTPRMAEARKQTEDMDVDGFTSADTPRWAKTGYGDFSSPQSEAIYNKLIAKTYKKKTKAQTKPDCQVTPPDATTNASIAWYSDSDFK